MAQRRRSDLETHTWRKMRLVVLNRDGWVCQLCGRPIDRHATPRSRWAASVDHIVSPELGGAPHDPRNLRAAHHGCNSSRKQGRKASRASRIW